MDTYQSFRFGAFELHAPQRLLLRDGLRVALGGKTFALLTVLLEHAGRTLSPAELMGLVWPGRVVDESNVRVHINRLRKLLDAGGQQRSCIQTLAQRGYNFIDAVQPIMALPPARPPGRAAIVPDLPSPLALFYGRDSDVEVLCRLLPLKRLMTVVGPGGVGKTELVFAVARATAGRTPQQVVYVDLAASSTRSGVLAAVAAACGCPPALASNMAQLGGWLSGRSALLLLDHCGSQIEGAAACCTALLRAAPELRILAASREPLRIQGEWVCRIGALALPPAGTGATLTARQAQAYPAVRLFVELVSEQLGGYQLSDADAALVALICQRLDGLPLALELAAGMVEQVGLAALAQGLTDSLALLTRGRRSADPRHRSLQASLDWSYRRLTPAEQKLLLELAARDADLTSDGCDMRATQDAKRAGLLCNLVQKSWVNVNTATAPVRYRLSNVTRLYLRAHLGVTPVIAIDVAADHPADIAMPSPAVSWSAAPELTARDEPRPQPPPGIPVGCSPAA